MGKGIHCAYRPLRRLRRTRFMCYRANLPQRPKYRDIRAKLTIFIMRFGQNWYYYSTTFLYLTCSAKTMCASPTPMCTCTRLGNNPLLATLRIYIYVQITCVEVKFGPVLWRETIIIFTGKTKVQTRVEIIAWEYPSVSLVPWRLSCSHTNSLKITALIAHSPRPSPTTI